MSNDDHPLPRRTTGSAFELEAHNGKTEEQLRVLIANCLLTSMEMSRHSRISHHSSIAAGREGRVFLQSCSERDVKMQHHLSC